MKHLQTGNRAEADELVRRFHYSHNPKMAGVALVVTWHEDGGLFGDSGPAWAACFFGEPSGRIETEGKTLELQRLVRDEEPGRPPLTGLISAGLHIIKRWKLADLVISYADTGQGHHGGVYRAASWDYVGIRQGERGLVVGGVGVHPRTAVARYGTRSVSRLAGLGIEAEETALPAKHLYAKALTRTGKRDMEAIKQRLGQ